MRELSFKRFIVLLICLSALKAALAGAAVGLSGGLETLLEGGFCYSELVRALGRGDYAMAVEVMGLSREGRARLRVVNTATTEEESGAGTWTVGQNR